MDYKRLRVKKDESEYFIEIDRDKLVRIDNTWISRKLRVRNDIYNEFHNKAIYLTDEYNWVLGRDDMECLCLVPVRKD